MLKRLNLALDDISLRNKVIAVVSIPLLILAFTLILMSWYERVSRNAQERVQHTLQVKAAIYEVMNHMTNSETGVRGYLLWKDASYLDPYNQARSQLTITLQELTDLVQDNSEQTSAATALRRQAFLRLDALRDMLNDPVAASQVNSAITKNSRDSMLAIREILQQMDASEKMLLTERIRAYDDILERINVSLFILFLLGLLGGIAASYIVSAGILDRVSSLEVYAARVSRNQTAEWKDSGDDELGFLGRSIRTMTQTLLTREEALRLTRRELEQANASLEDQLLETRAANQELEAFSYSVSHDLRAPLRHVAGFSELMLKNADSLDSKNLRYLNIISASIRQMGILIDELLAFSRMGRAAIKSDAVDLNETISEVFGEFSPEVAQRNIKWEIDRLPTVKGDKVMIHLVLQNLIGNAVKYTRDSDPAVIKITDESEPGAVMSKIVINDNGAGFDMNYADKLFGVFQRLHSSEDYEGTGIGLATVRRIVQRHGGQVSAKGEVGKGAEFSFTLPTHTEAEG